MTDQELAQAIHSGDEQAVRRLMALYYDDVYRFVSQSRIGREDAQDLTQQTFVSACRAMGSYRGEASLRTFLHRIAVREVYGWRRRLRRTLPLDGTERADCGIARLEAGVVLLDALERIPTRHRIAFQLYEVQRLSVAEVASAMGIPEGTVKSHLHYARMKLRALLEPQQETQIHATETFEG